ncbi:MAG: hypothetical protein Q8Q38_01390 [bacterium]|nr:hypothetical protein [bacterium]MDZ4232024.1 hypothetical protein [Candidatus Pacearchaeota archaeon]
MPEETQKGASILDPDVLIFALPFALLIDILDYVLEIGTVVSLIIGAPIILWMVWKAGNLSQAKSQVQQIRSGERRVAKRASKKLAMRALRRGVLVFIAELIPILNLFPFWLLAVVSTLRDSGKEPEPQQEEQEPLPQAA